MAKGRYTAGLSARERQYKHVLESLMDRGLPLAAARRIAASVVNKTRSRLAKQGRGPKLVSRGGSRRQWYPGKKMARERFVCLKHRKRFRSKAALFAHYRSHRKKRRR